MSMKLAGHNAGALLCRRGEEPRGEAKMKDARIGEKGSLLTWSREGVRGLFEGLPVRLAGHGPRLILGTAVGLLLLILAVRGVSWSQVRSALAKANFPLLAVALGTVLLTTLAKAARWRLLFPQGYNRPGLSKLFSVLLIGQTVNAILPARLGEIARAYLIGEIEGVDKALALSTVIVEKALDALMLLLLIALVFAFMPLPAWLGRSGILVSGLLAVAVGLLLVGVYRAQWIRNCSKGIPSTGLRTSAKSPLLAWIWRLVLSLALSSRRCTEGLSKESRLSKKGRPSRLDRLLSWIPGIRRFDLERRISTITAGSSALFQRDAALQLVGWSVFTWSMAALTNYLTFLALGIEAPFLAALLLLAALHLGVAVPSSPGRIGVFHYICILSLSLFSVDRNLALSYGLVLHLIVFAPMMSLGVWFLWKENYELSKLKAATTLAAGEGVEP